MYRRKGLLPVAIRTYSKIIIPPRKAKALFKCYFLHSKEFKFIHCSPSPYLGAKCKPKTNFVMAMEVTFISANNTLRNEHGS